MPTGHEHQLAQQYLIGQRRHIGDLIIVLACGAALVGGGLSAGFIAPGVRRCMHRPGDVLRLDVDLQDACAGLYVLLSVGDLCCLASIGEDSGGRLAATSRHVRVPADDFCLFEGTGLSIDPLASISY
jgi:hypothetical protein